MTSVANLQITDIAFGGKGVGRVDGKAAFVPYVIDGETISAHVVREHKKFIEAELEIVLVSSPTRVGPRCPYFGRCGGCVYQHIGYEHQLAIKSRQLEQTLVRIGGIANPPIQPMIPSPLPYAYRNRITVHARDGVVGFFRRESNTLLDIEYCPISSPAVNEQLAELRMSRPRDGHYTLRTKNRARFFAQASDSVAALMLDLVERLLATSPYGILSEANNLQSPVGTLIDAYCGAGFFAKRLRDRFNHVIGIDWDRHAIAVAREDANPNERYIAGDVEQELALLLRNNHCDALVVDPPAVGLSCGVRAAINEHPPARFIYVSCNPATLARDLAGLRNSFRVNSVTPLDMFPQTAEIEVVVDMRRA